MGEKYISAAQCRAARALISWTREELAEKAGVSKMTLADFETGKRKPYDRTLRDVERAFLMHGVVFCYNTQDGPGGRGVALLIADQADAPDYTNEGYAIPKSPQA